MAQDCSTGIPLRECLSEFLVCPECRGPLGRPEASGSAFSCPSCNKTYPVERGIPRFVSSEHYVASFGFQWTKYSKTQLDNGTNRNSEEFFRSRLGFAPEEMSGKLVLDVGCGTGRYAEVASRFGARVVGIDLSRAVESAYDNLQDRPNVQIMQADVFKLPFREQTFDFIYSIGVLHHTPDCEAAFRCLPRLLKPGGKIAIWVYSRYDRPHYFMSDIYRRVTTRMPHKLLYRLCYLARPLDRVERALTALHLRPAALMLGLLLPTSHHPDPNWRVLDTFDWYSPRYQSKHTYNEVFRWFESEKLVNIRILDSPISVQGQRPVNAVRLFGV